MTCRSGNPLKHLQHRPSRKDEMTDAFFFKKTLQLAALHRRAILMHTPPLGLFKECADYST